MGCFGGWGLFLGTPTPVLYGDLRGSSRQLGGGSVVGRGFGGSEPWAGSSLDPHAQLWALVIHAVVTEGYRGPISGMG